MEEFIDNPWVVISTVAAAIILIRNGWTALTDLIRLWKAPNAEQDARIDTLEKTTAELQSEAAAIQKRLDRRDDGMSVVYEAMLALLSHGIDGNNIQEMKNAKKRIEDYLISK